MTSEACTKDSCDGFFRGTAYKGWADSKAFVIDYNMPENGANSAIWALNGQVVRSAQYGCNCRGMGGDGGCGELDIAETLQPNSPQAISEIYSFKGATGSGASFLPRPTSGRATILVIFDVKTDSVTIQRLNGFDYAQTQLPRSMIDGYINAPAMVIPFGSNKRSVHNTLFSHRRHH